MSLPDLKGRLVMKKAFKVALILIIGLSAQTCDSPSGGDGGGGLFGGGGSSTAALTWDMMIVLTGSTACDLGLPGMGPGMDLSALELPGPGAAASLLDLSAGVYFPGLRVNLSDFQYDGHIPEVAALKYAVMAPGMVMAGDAVHVHFVYEAAADGEDGDYFLVRISDGDLFRIPAQARGAAMAAGTRIEVNYTYVARSDGFEMQFIVGLSSGADAVYIDELEVHAAGVPVFADPFDAGDYQNQFVVDGVALRLPMLPLYPSGSIGLVDDALNPGNLRLMIEGGRYYNIYGTGASMDGFSGAVLNYTFVDELDPLDPATFFGQSLAMQLGSMFFGRYEGFDSLVDQNCYEEGYVLISMNPAGDADLSGVWTLQVDAPCGPPNEGDSVHWIIGPPAYPPIPGLDPVSVGKVSSNIYLGYPFTSPDGDSFPFMAGLTMGSVGIVSLSAETGESAQMFGSYDRSTGVFAGQLMGSLPLPAGECNVAKGAFMAIIDKSVDVPPPLAP
jgi:hypothetical protein